MGEVVHLLLMLQEIWWGSTKKLGSVWRIPRFNPCRDDNYTTSQLDSSPQFFLAETHFKILEVTCWRSRLSCWGVYKLAVFAFFGVEILGVLRFSSPLKWQPWGWTPRMSNFNYEHFFNTTKKKNVKSEWIPERINEKWLLRSFFLEKPEC